MAGVKSQTFGSQRSKYRESKVKDSGVKGQGLIAYNKQKSSLNKFIYSIESVFDHQTFEPTLNYFGTLESPEKTPPLSMPAVHER